MNRFMKKCFFLAAIASLTMACGSEARTPAVNAAAVPGAQTSVAASNDANTPSGTACGNTNILTSASYTYAFFRRDDWTAPTGEQESNLYVFITADPNFCVDGNTSVDHDIPTLSLEHGYSAGPNAGPIAMTPETYPTNVTVDTHPVNGSSNGNNRVCDLYGSGGIVDNNGDSFGGGATGTFTLKSISATTLDFVLDASLSTYTVPANRAEAPIFSGQAIHYNMQAKACAFSPEDTSHGAPNASALPPVAPCPGTSN